MPPMTSIVIASGVTRKGARNVTITAVTTTATAAVILVLIFCCEVQANDRGKAWREQPKT